jgi:hypothetical protein
VNLDGTPERAFVTQADDLYKADANNIDGALQPIIQLLSILLKEQIRASLA